MTRLISFAASEGGEMSGLQSSRAHFETANLHGQSSGGFGKDVCCELSGRRLCDGLITRPEESYRARVCVSLSVVKYNETLDIYSEVCGQRSN